MQTFNFQTTPRILCECHISDRVSDYASSLNIKRLLIVTDEFLINSGLIDQAIASLKTANIAYEIYSDVKADPPESNVLAAVSLGKKLKADGVLGFGGGSPMDVAKLAALLINSKQMLSEVYGVGNAQGSRLPLLQIPTTAGTGSEVTPVAIISMEENETNTLDHKQIVEKKGVVSPLLLPDIALLDPLLTLNLPPSITAATGIDAMVHAIEAYTSKIRKNPVSDALAMHALTLLSRSIISAVKEGDKIESRQDMLVGACMAGMAFANAPVAAVHALAYPIGGHFHVPHGLSNALVLPHVLRFNAPNADDLYQTLLPVIFPWALAEGSAGEQLANLFTLLMKELGLKLTLREVGVTQADISSLAKDAMKQTRLLINNPREMSEKNAFDIYSQAL